jgi:hypothetical protein
LPFTEAYVAPYLSLKIDVSIRWVSSDNITSILQQKGCLLLHQYNQLLHAIMNMY